MHSAPTFTLNSCTSINDASVRDARTLRILYQTDRLIGVTDLRGKVRGTRKSNWWPTAKLKECQI
jgi:hypothetical protein